MCKELEIPSQGRSQRERRIRDEFKKGKMSGMKTEGDGKTNVAMKA
jgi:hypothetical protein